jgi:hypothetical protein
VNKPFLLFFKTFDPHNVYNMIAIMLDPHVKSLRIIENYVGHGATILLASKFDAKVMTPLLMACFDQLNPTSLACVIAIDVPNFQFEEEKGNMFGVGTFVEDSFHAFINRELFLFRRLFILAFACANLLSWWWCHEN